ncbi:MAG: CpsD/CapB family tyrosine-protein kinase [Clostridia bacterium]|nr:CpsD/CapB family tyrosine-protein kinase [Clostridia bacterium]
MKNKKKNLKIDKKRAILLDEDAPFAVRESFGLLRTNIIYTRTDGSGAPVFGITSAEEGAGKSTIIANLGLSFAQIEKKVLIIDADMRCPRQYDFFGYPKENVGLSEILVGMVKDKSDAIFKTSNKYLDVISSGHLPPNPSELILSSRFEELINELKTEYDFIFIDFPPVGVVADALSVVSIMSGYIFVIRANVSDYVRVTEIIENFEKVNANISGIVLSDVNLKDGIFASKYKRNGYGRYGKYGKYSKYSNYNKQKKS